MQIFPGHTAVASLYLSTDRAVDPKLLSAARLIDAELARKAPPVALPRPARIRLRRHLVVALMAQEIIRLAASQGSIAIDDFRRLGLSDTQIEDCRADAYGIAVADRPSLIALLGCAA
jgi:hypothetical protein